MPDEQDHWQDEAECRGYLDLFFPADQDHSPGGITDDRVRVRAAQAICRACPVQAQCRALADSIEANLLSRNSIHGVWAGETPRERIKRRYGKEEGAA